MPLCSLHTDHWPWNQSSFTLLWRLFHHWACNNQSVSEPLGLCWKQFHSSLGLGASQGPGSSGKALHVPAPMTLLALKQVHHAHHVCSCPYVVSLGRSRKSPIASSTRMWGEEQVSSSDDEREGGLPWGGKWGEFKWKITILGRCWQDSQIFLYVNGIQFN